MLRARRATIGDCRPVACERATYFGLLQSSLPIRSLFLRMDFVSFVCFVVHTSERRLQ